MLKCLQDLVSRDIWVLNCLARLDEFFNTIPNDFPGYIYFHITCVLICAVIPAQIETLIFPVLKKPRLVFWWIDARRHFWIFVVFTNGKCPKIPLRSKIKRMPANSAFGLNRVPPINDAVKPKGFIMDLTCRRLDSRQLNMLPAIRTRYRPPSDTAVMKNLSTTIKTLNTL